MFSVLSILYTWSYPGWLNRIDNSSEGFDKSVYFWNFFRLTLKSFNSEFFWVFSLIFFLIVVILKLKIKYPPTFSKVIISKKGILFLFILIVISNVLILIAFNGNLGYGRVHYINHILVVALLILIGLYFLKKIRLNFSSLTNVFTVMSLILFLIPLKTKIYNARKFSERWNRRDKFIKEKLASNDFNNCVIVEELPKSGILGYVDLKDEIKCDDFIGYVDELDYTKISNYDNWVFMKHYNTQFQIVLNKDVKNK